MFIPTTQQELQERDWDSLDVILVTGDTYIDSPFMGIAVIGKVLIDVGFRVGIIAQPGINSANDITRLGEPGVCWGISGGCMDSMVANYTANGKKRRSDDLTPGGINSKRPDRAVIVYCNLIRRYFKKTAPLVIGGVEASLRRVSHYDFWSDKIRKSILCDSKANYLVYGMGERAMTGLVSSLSQGLDPRSIRGICYLDSKPRNDYFQLPSHETVCSDKHQFIKMFHQFYRNCDPVSGIGFCQQQDTRYVVHNPPAVYLSQQELDRVYELDFERKQHPFHEKQGKVKAQETIQFSITTHRGCYGECNFCAVSMHQGRMVRWRSEGSILREAQGIAKRSGFRGIITDVGGPTANMYAIECTQKEKQGACPEKRCLFPSPCPKLAINHQKQLRLLEKLNELKGVRKVFIGSGIRYDMVLYDREHGVPYLKALVCNHISGQLKLAPEHCDDAVLDLMGKPGTESLEKFRDLFTQLNKENNKKQFLTYYFIAAHPGCSDREMLLLKRYVSDKLNVIPEQIQIFTPTPSTFSSLMYYTETNPFTMDKLFVEKRLKHKNQQKRIIVG